MSPQTPLRNPTAYFSTNSDPLASGTVVFLTYALVALVGTYLSLQHVFDQVTGLTLEQERTLRSFVPSLLVILVVGFVVAWLVVAAVVHVGSGGWSTDGRFVDALGVAGWAYAPDLLFFLPQTAYNWRKITTLELDGSDPTQLSNRANELATQLATEPIAITLLLVSTAWSVYILSYGVSETHDVSLDTAMLPAVVVGLGSILLTLIG